MYCCHGRGLGQSAGEPGLAPSRGLSEKSRELGGTLLVIACLWRVFSCTSCHETRDPKSRLVHLCGPRSGDKLSMSPRSRASIEKSLDYWTSVGAQPRRLGCPFDTLCNNPQAEFRGEFDRCAHDCGVSCLMGKVRDEAAVQLDLLNRQALQVEQRRIASSKVIESQGNTQFAKLENVSHR